MQCNLGHACLFSKSDLLSIPEFQLAKLSSEVLDDLFRLGNLAWIF